MQCTGKQGPARVAFGEAEASLRPRQSPCFEGKESQRQNSTAPGNGTFSRKGAHRSSEVKFRACSQQPGGKEAAMNACLPALPAFHFLNTSPASAPLSGQQGDLRGFFQTQAFWLWPYRVGRGAAGTQYKIV